MHARRHMCRAAEWALCEHDQGPTLARTDMHGMLRQFELFSKSQSARARVRACARMCVHVHVRVRVHMVGIGWWVGVGLAAVFVVVAVTLTLVELGPLAVAFKYTARR